MWHVSVTCHKTRDTSWSRVIENVTKFQCACHELFHSICVSSPCLIPAHGIILTFRPRILTIHLRINGFVSVHFIVVFRPRFHICHHHCQAWDHQTFALQFVQYAVIHRFPNVYGLFPVFDVSVPVSISVY